ncbi:3419_t:CDS:2, partial [Racocetra persica]
DIDKSLINHHNKVQLNENIDERLSLSIEHFHDFTNNDNQKNILVKSFNYYLEKDQINTKNLDIDKLLNKNENDLNAHQEEIRMQAFNLGLFYIQQRDIIGDETFRKAIKKREDWHKF